MAFSLLKRVNERVLSSVYLLDASLDVDYSIANIKNSITAGDEEKVEREIKSLLNFSEQNENALILQREWVGVVFQVIKWMGTNINVNIFSKILQLLIKMVQSEIDIGNICVKCCNPFDGVPSDVEYKDKQVGKKGNNRIIEEIIEMSRGGTLLIEVLKHLNYDEADIYIKYDIVKILCTIQRSELGKYKLDEIVLSQGDTIGMLLELLSDGLKNHSSYLENTLELLMLLTKKNPEVQKIITYNGSAQEIIDIVSEELDIIGKRLDVNSSVEFSSQDRAFNLLMGTVEFEVSDYSSINILEMSIEIIYHVSQSSNCLKYIIESQYSVKNKLTSTLEKLLAYYALILEHNSFKLDWNRYAQGEGENEGKVGNESDSISMYSVLSKTFSILLSYCSQLNRYDDDSLEGIYQIVTYTIANIYYVKYNIIDKIKDLFSIFQSNNIGSTTNPRWLLLELSSGMTPSIWYGFNKILVDYTPTIKYIMENKNSGNDKHMRQIGELRTKYISQMETSILYWLDKMILAKNEIGDIMGIINRDEWISESLSNTSNVTNNIRLSNMTPNGKNLLRNDLFINYVSLCFWFPILEFDRLNKTSFFVKFGNQLLDLGKIGDSDEHSKDIYLNLKYHYRLFRTFQGLQEMIMDDDDSPTFLIGGFGYLKTVNDLTDDIWDLNSINSNSKSKSYCNMSEEFPKEVLNNILQVTNCIIGDIDDTLKQIDQGKESSELISFLCSYCLNEPENGAVNKCAKYSYNSLTTLVQSVILLIIISIKGNIELQIPEDTLNELKKLNDEIKSILTDKYKTNGFCLISDLINIVLFKMGMIKSSNTISQIAKRLCTGTYDNKIVFSKRSYSYIINSLGKLKPTIFYQNDGNLLKYSSNIGKNINISGNINYYGDNTKESGKMEGVGLPCLNALIEGREQRLALGEEGVEGCCMNCIYLSEKIYKEREYFSNLVRKKQEEIDILVKAYTESRSTTSRKECSVSDGNTPLENSHAKDEDYMILLEMIGILNRKFPSVRRFIENNFILSSKTKSDMSNLLDLQGDELKDLECEYVHDFEECQNTGFETEYQNDSSSLGNYIDA